ncbi:amidohydrolase family protein [Cellulomonas wangsupingiae]|uniref:Amidohydrolase family protein n=1 Tax=Cellulomonas wangsupingiae TaxID=2968085 RepID=A0ABY5K8K4_9CELL|nr:amidohydrolase family protein [Cellulomonas wangsupingiae]MCC2336294.1 amidohydrolase family protein [Cellulomonas wangsupingiae]UUI65726.1 amidohydrolase family protein [Cellulomonas wangsupingiae]
MAQLVLAGRVLPMAQGADAAPRRGRVWIEDDRVVEVTPGRRRRAGFSGATEVDVGDDLVLPGFVDMHNHLAYDALPLWTEPGRTEPWRHNKHWPDADTYTGSVTEPAWVYAKACPEALLAYVQVRAMAGGATAAQGWPTSNRGYRTVVRNVDSEDAGTGRDDLIYTSVVTRTADALTESVRRMNAGSGFIYHCAEGRRGSRVLQDYTDLQRTDGLLSTLIAVHCCAVDAAHWADWDAAAAGGVVWSPLSNLVLYGETTLVDDARARGVTVCLGSDWGPSGTKNLLGEMKVARIAADHLGYDLTDAQIVEMVTSNPGTLLERCWHRPVGRLVPGAFADVVVIRAHGRDPWAGVVAAREQDVALVVVGGVPRYGDADLMEAAGAPPSFTATVGGRPRRVALPDPQDPAAAWSWEEVTGTLDAVQRDPQQAVVAAQARAAAGPRFAPDAELELFLDMPDTRRTGRAGPPKDPAAVRIPPVPAVEHDAAFFDALDASPIQGGVLAPLRATFLP